MHFPWWAVMSAVSGWSYELCSDFFLCVWYLEPYRHDLGIKDRHKKGGAGSPWTMKPMLMYPMMCSRTLFPPPNCSFSLSGEKHRNYHFNLVTPVPQRGTMQKKWKSHRSPRRRTFFMQTGIKQFLLSSQKEWQALAKHVPHAKYDGSISQSAGLALADGGKRGNKPARAQFLDHSCNFLGSV